mgnify:CR=1 FL=1|tara:strand:- start:124 stop:540 length:417 start_codon:yes stop_codon:yes gene_type:complete
MSNSEKRRKRRYYHIRKYKVLKGCCDCGYNKDSIALGFSHIDPATKSIELTYSGAGGLVARGGIAPLIRKLSLTDNKKNTQTIKTLFFELKKCKVQCHNCHAIETRNNGEYNWYKNYSKRNIINKNKPEALAVAMLDI